MRRAWGWMAWLWLGVVLAMGVHQVQFWSESRLDSDVMALLPEAAQDPVLAQAGRRMADAGARQVVVLLGADEPAAARSAASAYRDALRNEGLGESPLVEDDAMAGWFDAAREFYLPWRDRLLTPAQIAHLRSTPVDALATQALAGLYGPFGGPRVADWEADPLNLWAAWWHERLDRSGVRFDENGLLRAEGRVWAVLQLRTRVPAFRLDGEPHIGNALDRAAAAARDVVPDVRELRAGVPLHAEAAAVQASTEVNIIGWGSLAAVLLLAWLAFRSMRPILLVTLSLLIGVMAALSVTALVFGKVHLLTLVFGASLVGVAEDYGIHWFTSRQGHPRRERFELLRWLLPGMLLAWATSALAYLALGLAPFPGLRQMAVFSITGLAAAFITAVTWFPWLDRKPPPPTRLSTAMSAWFERWPRMRDAWSWRAAVVIAAIFVGGGLWKLQASDDLRMLQSSPPELLLQQAEVGRLLGLPSPAQFYLVRADDADALLQREHALLARLSKLADEGIVRGYRAIGDWLPSSEQQAAAAALSARVETQALARLSDATGESLARPAFAGRALTIEEWLASPASQPMRQLWLGPIGDGVASVVLVDAADGGWAQVALREAAVGLAGVRWVDRTADYSTLLGHYRHLMLWMLLGGSILVAACLWIRYRRDMWRIMLPTVLAGILAIATLGWLGEPLQLFNVLALLLLLGMGIDYGIFLLEHAGDPPAWLAVCVGAGSTWLSFGLLALSATPALHAFGLTLLLGIGLVWLLAPLLRRPAVAGHSTSRTSDLHR